MRFLVVLAALLLPCVALAAPPPLDSAALATADAYARCEAAGGKAQPKFGYTSKVEINQDGKYDAVLDLAHLDCNGVQSPVFCAAEGCEVRIFLSSKDGLQPALDVRATRWSLAVQEGHAVLTLGLQGAGCATPGQPCEAKLTWDGKAFIDQRTGAPFAGQHAP